MLNSFDIIGPIMIGPSSSHTAGAVRIGLYSRLVLDEKPAKATVFFSGSFAKTYKGHGTDIAVIAGILGMDTDDENIPRSFEIAKEQGMDFAFEKVKIDNSHPNTMKILLVGVSGKEVSVQGCSVGGGNIRLTEVNESPVAIDGKSDTLIIPHKDVPGMIGMVSNILGACSINIKGFSLHRDKKGGTAVMTIEVDGQFDESIKSIFQKNESIFNISYLKAL